MADNYNIADWEPSEWEKDIDEMSPAEIAFHVEQNFNKFAKEEKVING